MRRMPSSEFRALCENDQGRFLAALGSALGVLTGEAELRELANGIWEEPASDSSACFLVERPREVVPAAKPPSEPESQAAKPEGAASRPAAAPSLVGVARAGHSRFGGAGGPPGGGADDDGGGGAGRGGKGMPDDGSAASLERLIRRPRGCGEPPAKGAYM